MKFKAIIYQNNPKKIHGSCEKIDLRLIQHDYVYEEEEEEEKVNTMRMWYYKLKRHLSLNLVKNLTETKNITMFW